MTDEARQSFMEVKERLDEIVDAVSDDDISLDKALDLYEEAIKLGMKVSAVLEEDISDEQVSDELADMQAAGDFDAEVAVDITPEFSEQSEEVEQSKAGDAKQEAEGESKGASEEEGINE